MQQERLEEFLGRVDDGLVRARERLVVAAGDSDSAIAEALYHILHTVKGDAAVLGQVRLKVLAHALEYIVRGVREERIAFSDEWRSVFWDGLDLMQAVSTDVRNGDPGLELTPRDRSFTARVEASELLMTEPVSVGMIFPPEEKVRYRCGTLDVTRLVHIILNFLERSDNRNETERTERFLFAIRLMGDILHEQGFRDAGQRLRELLWDYEAIVDDAQGVPGAFLQLSRNACLDMLAVLERIDLRGDDAGARTAVRKRRAGDGSGLSFRVEYKSVRPVTVSAVRIRSIAERLAALSDADTGGEPRPDDLRALIAVFTQEHRLLMKSLRQMLYVESGEFYRRMTDQIKAASERCRKTVTIACGDPFMYVERAHLDLMEKTALHLYINCLEHGIEDPAVRTAKGKTPRGTISISVDRDGDRYRFVIADDGRGVDLDALTNKAAELGIVDPRDVGRMSGADKLSLLFEAGVSTAPALTETSGRGIGLHAVRDIVADAGGTIEVRSDTDGTRFEITLPTGIATVLDEGGAHE